MKKSISILLCLMLCLGICAAAGKTEADAYVSAGDTVTMGEWGGEEITWRVLEVKEDGTCVLLSEYGLDARAFHTENTEVAWETCSLRAWLNDTFVQTAFTEAQKSRLVPTVVENPGNAYWGTGAGHTTVDIAYLLSLEEVGRYFNVDPYNDAEARSLICLPTETAVRNGANTLDAGLLEIFQSDSAYTLLPGACIWWLRSPGELGNTAACVIYSGYVGIGGFEVNAAEVCVRPVICARL